LDIFERHFYQAIPHLYTSDFNGSSRGGFGLQGGIGLEYDITSRLAVFISGGLSFSCLSLPAAPRPASCYFELELTSDDTAIYYP
jgi:hypothetical protein